MELISSLDVLTLMFDIIVDRSKVGFIWPALLLFRIQGLIMGVGGFTYVYGLNVDQD